MAASALGALATVASVTHDRPALKGKPAEPVEISAPRSVAVSEKAAARLTPEGHPGAWEFLANAATEDSLPAIRAEALFGLAELGGAGSAAVIERALSDPDPTVRAGAVDALMVLDEVHAVGPLTQALHDENAEIRRAAWNALEDIRDGWRR